MRRERPPLLCNGTARGDVVGLVQYKHVSRWGLPRLQLRCEPSMLQREDRSMRSCKQPKSRLRSTRLPDTQPSRLRPSRPTGALPARSPPGHGQAFQARVLLLPIKLCALSMLPESRGAREESGRRHCHGRTWPTMLGKWWRLDKPPLTEPAMASVWSGKPPSGYDRHGVRGCTVQVAEA